MADAAKCSRCGTELSPDAAQGLCPRCLIEMNLGPETEAPSDAGPHGTHIVNPHSGDPLSIAAIAKHFPQLEILECLGRGGMGVVYKARQSRLDRFVALKILAREKEKDPHFAERFQREAQALARLSHSNIVMVYDFGETAGLYYLLMEYVDGLNLRQLLQTSKMTPQQALSIVPKICEALQYAHEQQIVHRDIKPENVLVDKYGRVKIADFGIAKILGQTRPNGSLTGEKGIIGTPHYMAPEQIEKPATVDHRADIYSLGVVFYELLTGELPLGRFPTPSQKIQVDVRLDEIVLHALEKEPKRRYQQAREIKTDVETVATSRHAGKSIDATRNAWLLPRPRFALVMMTLMFALLGVAILLNFFRSNALSSVQPQQGATALHAEQSPSVLDAGRQPVNLQADRTQTPGSHDYATELRRASRELDELRQNYTDTWPAVINKTREVAQLRSLVAATAIPEVTPDAETLPPVVVRTSPVSGTRDVAPGVVELSVTFSKDMVDDSWSWCTAWDDSMPEIIEGPRYLADHRTCVIKAKLEPGRTYATWLNSDKFENFRGADGIPGLPYLLIFETKGRTKPTTQEGRWREDLEFFATTLNSGHKDFAKLATKDSFKRELSELKSKADRLSDSEIIIRLMREIASLGVAHATVDWRSDKFDFHFYPLRLRWFGDGLAVVAAAPSLREAIGARVVRIGSETPEKIEAAVTPYISHENQAWLHYQSPNYMVFDELLAYLKIVPPKGRVEFAFEKSDGKRFTLNVPKWPLKAQTNMVSAWDALQIPTPLYRKQPDAAYWRDFLEDTKTLYIQYNKCQNVGQPFESFAQEALSFADSHSVDRVVVDLRFNAGGDSRVVQPLIQGLKKRRALSALGHLYALIGPVTYSSGMMAAMDFKDELRAILVGEPTGGRPNQFGEIKRALLPNSNLAVYYPVKYFHPIQDADPESVLPDIPAILKWEDFLAGRDPVLEKAISNSF
jgi:serine/threonine protein kinase